jgi:phosphotransferase system enzyme I (PtsI)
MIEIPSAALLADHFAKEADFLSIGTNDLIQYLCAVDRLNESVHDLYDPHHPALWQLLKKVCDAAQTNGKWAGICGELAGQLEFAPLLIALNLHELSMAPPFILKMRKRIQQLNLSACEKLLNKVLELPSSEAVKNFLKEHVDSTRSS